MMHKAKNSKCRSCNHLHYFDSCRHIARCTLGIYCLCDNFIPKDNLEYLEWCYEKSL